MFHLTSDSHPVVQPETLLFSDGTYTFLISIKKSVISYFSLQITFWIVIIIFHLINYPLSIIIFFFFFIIAADKIFRWTFAVPAVHVFFFWNFYKVTAARFYFRRARPARDKFIAVDRVEKIVGKLFLQHNTIFWFSLRAITDGIGNIGDIDITFVIMCYTRRPRWCYW